MIYETRTCSEIRRRLTGLVPVGTVTLIITIISSRVIGYFKISAEVDICRAGS